MALCLDRKKGERVVIEVPPSTETTTILVDVAQFFNRKVKLAFAAPRDVTINRSEVHDKIQREKLP